MGAWGDAAQRGTAWHSVSVAQHEHAAVHSSREQVQHGKGAGCRRHDFRKQHDFLYCPAHLQPLLGVVEHVVAHLRQPAGTMT